MHKCIYIYIYIYIHTHTHKDSNLKEPIEFLLKKMAVKHPGFSNFSEGKTSFNRQLMLVTCGFQITR